MTAGGQKRRRGKRAKPIADLLDGVMAPILARRAAMSYQLLAAWPELIGPDNAAFTRPERILWPRRAGESDPFQPGTLVVACDSGSAIVVQHEADHIRDRVNAYLGFHAIARIKIVQKPVRGMQRSIETEEAPLDPEELRQLGHMLNAVQESGLRRRLEKLGRGVLRKQRAGRRG
jgi:hypothetical protein